MIVYGAGDDEYVDLDRLSPFTLNNVETQRKNRLSHQFYEVFGTEQKREAKYDVRKFRRQFGNSSVTGHQITITNAFKMLSLLEPKKTGGCLEHNIATVLETSKQRDCHVAVNAGFYNEETGQCYGNLVSDGAKLNRFRGLKSANFGIRKDGSLVMGYLKETDIADMRTPIFQLVSGVGWLLRNGDSYIHESLKHEQCNMENLEHFFSLVSARTFVGHDTQGTVHIVQVEGKTELYGINLYDAVKLLKSFGLVNAINLNGGGSSTLVINKTLTNYPSNVCYKDGGKRLCSIEVSSVLCVHMPDKCIPGISCSGNGHCNKGKCQCYHGWTGNGCEFNGGILESCCWRNYNLVIVLSALVATSVLVNVYLCDLFMLYRFRSRDLSRPKHGRKDRLRTYLRENSVLSSNDESTDLLTSVENLNTGAH